MKKKWSNGDLEWGWRDDANSHYYKLKHVNRLSKAKPTNWKRWFSITIFRPVLDRVVAHEFYIFLDVYYRHYQIEIAPEDQEKTTYTYPFDTFTFGIMSFELCNAPAPFWRCMISIFSNMVNYFELFMDDFFVFGDSFESYDLVRSIINTLRTKEFASDWEKRHFMLIRISF